MPLNPEKNPSFQRHVKEKKLINRTAARIGESFAGKQKRRKKIPETANESFIIMKIAHTHSVACQSVRSDFSLCAFGEH